MDCFLLHRTLRNFFKFIRHDDVHESKLTLENVLPRGRERASSICSLADCCDLSRSLCFRGRARGGFLSNVMGSKELRMLKK